MAEQLPESAYERMSADERAKERLERQKMLVSLPKGNLEQKYMAFAATLSVEAQENLEDLLLMANALPGAPAAVADGKNRLIQAGRGALERASRAHKIALIAAKEGPDTAQRIFNPEPSYAGMNEEETKMLEKIRKEKEAARKKEARRTEEHSFWKRMKTTQYGEDTGMNIYLDYSTILFPAYVLM
jgi:hypothetical protein